MRRQLSHFRPSALLTYSKHQRYLSSWTIAPNDGVSRPSELQVLTVSPIALKNLLLRIGNQKRPLQVVDISNITTRIEALQEFVDPSYIAAAAHALSGTHLTIDNASVIENYVGTLASRSSESSKCMRIPDLVKCLSALSTFSDWQTKSHGLERWSEYLKQLAFNAHRLVHSELYFSTHKLTPECAVQLLSPFQHTSAILDGEMGPSSSSNAFLVALKLLLHNITVLITKRTSGRFRVPHVSLAFLGIHGMSNSYSEVCGVLKFLKLALRRLRSNDIFSGRELAHCFGALFNMSPFVESDLNKGGISEDHSASCLGKLLTELLEKGESVPSLAMRDIGTLVSCSQGLSNESNQELVARILIMTTRLIHRSRDVTGDAKDDSFACFQSFACSVYCVASLSDPKYTEIVNTFLLELCKKYKSHHVHDFSSNGTNARKDRLTAQEEAIYDIFSGNRVEAACLALYGMREVDDTSDGVRQALFILRAVMESDMTQEGVLISNELFSFALHGISNMSSDCEAVVKIVNVLNRLGTDHCDPQDTFTSEHALLCLSSLNSKRSDSSEIRSLLYILYEKLNNLLIENNLEMTNSDISLAFCGLKDLRGEDSVYVIELRRILRYLLEANYNDVTQSRLSANEAAVILSSLSQETYVDHELLALFKLLAALIHTIGGFTNEYAALAMSGLTDISNEYQEVRMLISAFSSSLFLDNVDTEEGFKNEDIALFLNGFKAMKSGLEDEHKLDLLLAKALYHIENSSPDHLPMSPAQAELCMVGLAQLGSSSSNNSNVKRDDVVWKLKNAILKRSRNPI